MTKNNGPGDTRSCVLNIQLRTMFDTLANRPTPHDLVLLVEQLMDTPDRSGAAVPANSQRWVA